MWWMAAIAAAQAISSYSADKATTKAQKAMQAYKNAMANVNNASNQNVMNENQIESNQAFADQAVGIKQQDILTTAQAEVSAAAAGVKGRSVAAVQLDINRSAANAERNRQVQFAQSTLSFASQRQQSAQAAANAQDYSYIPTPKLGSYLLNAAASVAGSKQGMGDRSTPSTTPTVQPTATSSRAGADTLDNSWFGRQYHTLF